MVLVFPRGAGYLLAMRGRHPQTLGWLVVVGWLGACGQDDVPAGTRPVAVAGADKQVTAGFDVSLDGRQSRDASGQTPSRYRWTLVSLPPGSVARLDSSSTSQTLLSTDVIGTYLVSLVVTDAQGRASLPDVVVVEAANLRPVVVADCRTDDTNQVLHGGQGALDGSCSFDTDSNALSYEWQQLTSAADCQSNCPGLTCQCTPTQPCDAPASIANPARATTDFTAPNGRDQQLIFELKVSDGTSTVNDCVLYTTRNAAPTITNATATVAPTPDLSVVANDTDPEDFGVDGSTLLYTWEQIAPATPVAAIATPSASTTAWTPPTVTQRTTFTFQITVSDGVDTAVAQPSIDVTP